MFSVRRPIGSAPRAQTWKDNRGLLLMAVRFAAARSVARSPIARALARRAVKRAANDNGAPSPANEMGDTMRAALRHFAGHGMASALIAARRAETAHEDGDETARRWWLAICSSLDRALALRVEQRLANPVLLMIH